MEVRIITGSVLYVLKGEHRPFEVYPNELINRLENTIVYSIYNYKSIYLVEPGFTNKVPTTIGFETTPHAWKWEYKWK